MISYSKNLIIELNKLNLFNEELNSETNKLFKNGLNELIKIIIYSNKIINNSFKNLNSFLKININTIQQISDIPIPHAWNSKYIPKEFQEFILEQSSYVISCKFTVANRNIEFINVLIDENYNYKLFLKKIKKIATWIQMVQYFASHKCAKNLKIYLFETPFKKKFPEKNSIISTINVNTGVSDICQNNGEIVLYRLEEWFKVLIHESFHNFGLDFSSTEASFLKKKIHSIFPLKINVLLFESYTETWANIINTLFYSYENVKNSKIELNETNIENNFLENIKLEVKFSLNQLVKILNFMGLKYENLFKKNTTDELLRNNLYKEDTNVFAYYIIKAILLNNYKVFIAWCQYHNKKLLKISESKETLECFFQIISYHYKSKIFMKNLKKVENFINNNKMNYDSLRMTILEF